MTVVDTVAPNVEYQNNYISNTHPNEIIKPKINKKRRLLKQLKANNNEVTRDQLRVRNKEIVNDIKKSKKNMY